MVTPEHIQLLGMFIKEVGFPIAACLALFYLIGRLIHMMQKQNDQWRITTESNVMHMAKAINNLAEKTATAIDNSAKQNSEAIRHSSEINDRVLAAIMGTFSNRPHNTRKTDDNTFTPE